MIVKVPPKLIFQKDLTTMIKHLTPRNEIEIKTTLENDLFEAAIEKIPNYPFYPPLSGNEEIRILVTAYEIGERFFWNKYYDILLKKTNNDWALLSYKEEYLL